MSDENKNGLTMGGVSGNKKMTVRRVHKKKAEETPAAPVTETPVKEETAVKEEKPEVKKTSSRAKTAKTAEVKETPEVKAVKEEKETKAPAKKTSTKTKAEPKKEEAPKAEAEPVAAPEVKAPEVKPEVKEEAKPAESKAAPEAPKSRFSSAIVSMPGAPARGETVRSSTVISRDKKYPPRNGQGGPRPSRPQSDRPAGGRGGVPSQYLKDKDEDAGPRQPQRKPKPKSDEPAPEIKKSRANFAERNAFDKKRNDDRREGGKNQNDKRKNNNNSGRYGRVNEDGEYDEYTYRKKKKTKSEDSFVAAPVAQITEIQIPPFITVKEFAEGIGKKSSDVIMELMKLGVMANINQELDFDTAFMLADAFGISATPITEVTEEDILFEDDDNDNDENAKPRPPVVVVMGHVDHGKTSLLDKIRSSSVVAGEAGGITQHIGAYTVRLKGRQITFLDTPGHEAFTTMRARGAQFTDIAILVVAADDGVMPQTVEAINHAKAANTEIIVAINKMDKPGANPDKVKQELSNYELIPEEWGGSTIMVPVSAKMGQGIDELLEMVLLTADVMELKADPKKQAKGAVIEAQLDKNRGPVATVLVQRGTLKQGDTVVCGAMIGNVRAMFDDKGNAIKKAGPSIPVEILGLPEVPEAGELLYAVTDDKIARQLVEKRKIKQREEHIRKSSKMSLDTLAAQMAAGDVKDLNIIIKADVQGSVEAVKQSLEKLSNDEVKVKVIHDAVGAINESDISLADVSNAIIIGFNVRPNQKIMDAAKEAGVDIRLYSVIYKCIEDVELAMKGMLAPTIEESVLGHVEIRELFKVSGVGTIGGSYVLDGKITRNSEVRVVRQDVVVYTGHLGSLQRLKDSVKEVNAGFECGLTIENYNDIKIGDIIEAYEMVEVERT